MAARPSLRPSPFIQLPRLPAGLHGPNESAKLGKQGHRWAKKGIETDPSWYKLGNKSDDVQSMC